MSWPRALSSVVVLACAVPAAADLADVKSRGGLRVLVVGVRSGDEFFAPAGAQPGFDREVLAGFASLQRVRLEVVPVVGWDALIPELLLGTVKGTSGLFLGPPTSLAYGVRKGDAELLKAGEMAPDVLKKARTDSTTP